MSGQLLGGLLTGADVQGLSWRAVFLINVPTGIVLAIAVALLVPATRGATPRHLDLPGALLLAAAVLAIMLPLVLGPERGWPSWVWVTLGAGVVLAAATAAYLRTVPADRALLDLAMLRRPGVAAGIGSLVATMSAYGGLLFTMTLLLQDSRGFTPVASGLAVTPYIVGFAATSLLAGRLPERRQRPTIVVGLLLTAVSYAGLGFATPGGIAAGTALAVAGAGIGLGFGPVMALVTQQLPPSQVADASGALTTVTQLGYLTGVATIGTLFVSTADLPTPGSAARAFTIVALIIGTLALAAAILAAHLIRTARRDPRPAETVAS